MEKTYYLYRHIRLDKNEPFYIGIGVKDTREYNKPSEKTLYSRAYCSKIRSKLWKKIQNKTEYEIEILFESNDREFIKSKEIEFIKLYGRINLKTGTLANLTDGGEGCNNLSEESKDRIATGSRGKIPVNKGKKTPQYIIDKMVATRKRNGYKSSQKQKDAASKQWKGRVLSNIHLVSLKKSVSKEINIYNDLISKDFDSFSDCIRFLLSNNKASKKEIDNMNYRINKAIKNNTKYLNYNFMKKKKLLK